MPTERVLDMVEEARILAAHMAALMHAAKLLAKSLPDSVLEDAREPWGNTNVAVVRHWRDEVFRLLDTDPTVGEVAHAD